LISRIEEIKEVKLAVKKLKTIQWDQERKLKKVKNEDDYNRELKSYIMQIKMLKGRVQKVKDRRRINEKNQKKAQERMIVLQDKYTLLCTDKGVTSKLKSTNQVMSILRRKKKPSHIRRRERGEKIRKRLYKSQQYTASKYGSLFEQLDEMPVDVSKSTLVFNP